MIPKIAGSEWRIMTLLWKKSPQTASEIIAQLAGEVEWKPKTIKTLLSRLVTKNAIRFEKEGRGYLYFPIVTEDECKRVERETFLRRVYNGALKPMFTAFLEDEKLSQDDIDELKRILEEKGK